MLDKYLGFVLCFPDSFYTNVLTARPRFSVIQTDYKLNLSPKMLSPHLHLTIQYLYITVYKVCVCSGAGYQGCHCTDSSSPQPWLVFQLLKLKKHLTDQNCQWKQLLVIFYTTIIQSVLHTSHCLVLLSREEGQWAIRSAERIVQFISISKMPTQHQLGNLKVYINKLPFKNVFF